MSCRKAKPTMTYAPSDDSDQTGHPSIRVFAVCSLGSLGHADSED